MKVRVGDRTGTVVDGPHDKWWDGSQRFWTADFGFWNAGKHDIGESPMVPA
jgi:hypothetical protein